MRRLSLLKTVTDILFILTMIGAIFGLPLIIMVFLFPDSIPFKLDADSELLQGKEQWEIIILLLLLYVGALFFVYALYLFRKTLDLFRKRIIFDDRVIKNFDQTGKAILIGYSIIAASIVLAWITSPSHDITIGIAFNNSLLTIGLGLFFIVLAEVFQTAKGMKEENELTV
ncbi:DUF2975 domain-containing protein [Flavobacterium litorale]|uniref:DUF2975 domain-containing protein n=1 Tax=Flavobacterium litorale TaxID=2856519 RepID=A0ABX8VEY6_9FLAO|nr:DUF2975 domain-containing protein [Flavobacterium litorale]QYJ69176.1 DUF2975 domain-containing protein [Flavobacterium litorale]